VKELENFDTRGISSCYVHGCMTPWAELFRAYVGQGIAAAVADRDERKRRFPVGLPPELWRRACARATRGRAVRVVGARARRREASENVMMRVQRSGGKASKLASGACCAPTKLNGRE
jgi:hypothetical protein